MQTTRLNPYVVGGALNDQSGTGFFGRADVFEFVQRALFSQRRIPIVLFGQRRIGKSSVLRQLPRHLAQDAICVYYDLQGKSQLGIDALLYGLARAIADAAGIARPTREAATGETFPEFLRGVLVALRDPRRLVLLFDEFDVVDSTETSTPPASAFIGYLARLSDDEPEIGFVVVVGRKTHEMSDEFLGSLLRNSVQKRLGRLAHEESDRLVNQLAMGTLAMNDEALGAVYHFAAGQPFCTQLLCHTVWNRVVRHAPQLPAIADANAVHEAIPEALDLGTNGLNWIYDGLDLPTHRLFLASLASQAGADGEGAVSLIDIERLLAASGLDVDAAALRTAPMRLANWDVLENSPAGYRFVVPMIALWIRTNRPLAQLEQEARLANPHAWKYYELALLNQQQDDHEAAIANFERTLAANPALVEAYLGLAASYRARRRRGDIGKAVEVYERALERDPRLPPRPLLETLLESLDEPGLPVAVVLQRYGRIKTLDRDHRYLDASRRRVTELGVLRIPFRDRFSEAEQLLQAVDATEPLIALHARMANDKWRTRFNGWVWLGWAVSLGLAIWFPTTGVTRFDAMRGWARVSSAALSATLMGLAMATEKEQFSSRFLSVPLGAFLVTLTLYYFFDSIILAAFVGWIAAILATEGIFPTPDLPPDLKPVAVDESSPVTSVRRALIRFLSSPDRKGPK